MIIIKFCGGLGNQLFQFALGRRLALINKATVRFDAAPFELDSLRGFSLAPFELDIEWARPEEIEKLAAPTRPTGLRRLIPKPLRPRPPKTHIRETQPFHFEPRILDISDEAYLDGYWQSEKYFADIAPTLRRDLKIKTPPDGRNREMLDRIRACTSVSLHVRRGDYVANPKTSTHHGTCDLDYYRWAIGRIAESINGPELFVFSDEPEWARENLDLGLPVSIVDVNDTEHGHEDLRLMSACHHHVIANSSFSWWGAWLNPNPSKMVLAPSAWLAKKGASHPDILPAGWIREEVH